MRLEADDGRPEASPPLEESSKRQIVQLYENGKPAREIKAEYDISHSTLHRWVQGPTAAPESRRRSRHPEQG